MDKSSTALKKCVEQKIKTKNLTQRNKLIRSTESVGRQTVENNNDNTKKAATPNTNLQRESSVMGGGFTTPPILQFAENTALATIQMHEKYLDKEDTYKDKTEKLKLIKKDNEKPTKPHKESKFAEKLRRSFRRGEHKSLEIKRTEKIESPQETHSPQDNKNFIAKNLHLQKNSRSIFSLTNLPGIGGHINPALLLDSPDESTPPEYAYQHLSSVATTNSSTSLESNFDFGEHTSSQSSISYWAWQQSNSSMGGEVSTTSNSTGFGIGAAANETKESKESKDSDKERTTNKLEAQNSNRSDTLVCVTTAGSGTHIVASRSCSITSESSSAKLTRLQNFLFKSSNESSKSFQGHSNEGFTASSHNSSSGEWENLSTFATSTTQAQDFQVGSFPEETINEGVFTTESDEANNYYQYTLTSPNNPFLPEIIARTYHSAYDDEQQQLQQQQEDELDANVTSVKYRTGPIGTHSAQLPTPSYSRAGSQESTHSEGNISLGGGGSSGVHAPTPSPASSSSSTPGRQKRKLFSLHSPTRRLYHHPQPHHSQNQQQQHQQQQQQQQQSQQQSSVADATKTTSASGSFVRSLNPFLPVSSANSTKRAAPLKQSAVTSPIAVPQDLNAKREEFLRATMKICLVVSPPTSKLQLKSKSLTHLDGLESMIACHQGTDAGKSNSESPALTQDITVSPLLSQPQRKQQSKQPQQQLLAQTHHTTSQQRLAQPPPTIYTQAPQQPATKSSPVALSPTTTITTSCCNNKICCLGGGGNGSATISGESSINTSHHIVKHQFQSGGSNDIATSIQHSLTPALTGFNNTTTTSIANNNSLNHGIGFTGTNYKKKSSFMQRKKPLLTRSEVSSSEYFSVSFYNDQGCQDEEFIPATKGVTLSAALSQTLRRRNLSFSQIAITDNTQSSNFLEAGSSPFLSSLDENTEVENLAGRHLIITERDGSRKLLQKAASFGARTRPPRLLSSASTEETTDNSQPGKQIKQRWSGLFGSKNQQQSQLCELLNNYAKNGVPQKSAALNFDHPHFDEALEYLDNMHKSWRDFVDSEAMSEIETRIQTAIWELVTTEVYYIHALQTVTDLFLACLEAVQEERLLTDVDQNRLFSNVRDICEANLKFWTLYLYPMVAHSVTSRSPLSIAFFHQGFVTFASIFAPYKKYCAEQSTCQFYCKELNHTNALFTSYLAWCESQKMCNRLRLADILVRPMQRLTKYSLLLAAIKKHMSDVNEIEALDTMIHTVENFVFSVNNHLTTRQESERLKGVMARIESYDVVDTNNEQLEKMIKQYSQMFDLCAPMKGCPAHQVRHLFMEGDHKFKDNLGKADVHCFLLTDMLLVCKTIAKKGLGTLKMIRQPYLTDRLVVQHSNNILNCVYLNEFQVAITAFTLQCSEAKNWHDSIYRAKTIYTRLKQGANNWDSFRFGGSGASGGTADSLGVKKSPINSSICSHVSSANNSHSGSVEWNDSRNISVDFEKTNSLSSDEGSSLLGLHGFPLKGKNVLASPHKLKTPTSSANTLSVQPINSLGQSLPNLNLHHSQINNTLLVPGTTTSHSGNLLLSPSHRGISYPPPSPTRVPLRRGMAFSTSTKNPPLVKTRNITSQNSINWHQIPATPTPLSPQYQTAANNTKVTNSFGGLSPTTMQSTHMPALSNENIILESPEHHLQQQQTTPPKQLSNSSLTENSCQLLQNSNETDV